MEIGKMSQFYAQASDKERCLDSLQNRQPLMVTGLNVQGTVQAFTGIVQSVDDGHNTFAGYPLRITMTD
jgi:hypothetical protein